MSGLLAKRKAFDAQQYPVIASPEPVEDTTSHAEVERCLQREGFRKALAEALASNGYGALDAMSPAEQRDAARAYLAAVVREVLANPELRTAIASAMEQADPDQQFEAMTAAQQRDLVVQLIAAGVLGTGLRG